MTAASVRVRGWGFRHAGRRAWALRELDVSIEPGERVLLAGASGAGKSTLLSALAGLLDPDHSGETEGTLDVDGTPGLMFQDPETQLVMARAGDDVAFGLENHAVPSDQIWSRVDLALKTAGFPYEPDHPTGWLSGGEKQRLVLAGVLALRPGLLLLDEPTANLDPDGAALVRDAVRHTLAHTETTLVVVEHRPEEWSDIVDRMIVLEPGGGVRYDGPPVLSAAPVAPRRTTRPGGSTALAGTGLAYEYPGTGELVVDDATVELRSGEALAITGPNGSGKSTLALLLAGLLKPSAGASYASGSGRSNRPLHRLRAERLVRKVGSVFQDPEHQFLANTVADELALGPRRIGLADNEVRRRVAELLERLGLDRLANANPFTLSGGEKRRLSVATALATEPGVLILDEPTFGQDERTWWEMRELLADLRDAGHAVCCVSHDRLFVDAVADRELRIDDGRIVEGVR